MLIATFNVNSVRIRQEILLDWMAQHQPDVLALQETKVEDSAFPREAFEEAGYHVTIHGQKSYNGVAFLSRTPPQDVRMGMRTPTWPTDCRILAATFGGVRVVNTYVPNGTKVGTEKFDYKLQWLEQFGVELQEEKQKHGEVIWLGDINVAPKPEDVFDSARVMGGICHHPAEFERLAKIVETCELTDLFRSLHPEPGQFSFWEFFLPKAFERNLGWRIDHIYATPGLVPHLVECQIDREPRKRERPSDHTVVMAELSV